jgi:hypothetical protein
MDFADAVDLFNYWADNPTITMMVRGYLGIDESKPINTSDPMAVAAAMKAVGIKGRAEKLDRAPPKDRQRFLALKKQLEESRGRKN